ncbi:MAG: cell division protein ZapE [Rhodospirillaceae bacterium]|nr:cell division protein ZapE [Rhodospirillaceae bacterium]
MVCGGRWKPSFPARPGIRSARVSAPTTPMDAYRNLISTGAINPDPIQEQAMQSLQALNDILPSYGEQMGKTGWRARLSLAGRRMSPPQGLYFYGGVGRGKTMLMDLFYDNCAVSDRTKQHVHFHAFMQEVHRRLHAFREAQKAGKVDKSSDGVAALAKVIAERAWLLCFDEFHVTDIADAMILGRLFKALFQHGIVVVTTSNRHPKDLYKDGLQRELFLPFIGMLEEKLQVFELDNGTDYRLERLRALDIFITPSGPEADGKLDKAFQELSIGAEAKPRTFTVNGRDVEMPKTAEGVAFATFTELCEKPLGPGDYLAFAETFHTVVLKDVPRMSPANRNEAKRFVTLIDALYEAKVKLICSAAAEATELYTEGDGAFEFERTVSRLIEMQSPDYMALPHNIAT